jgi:ribosomal protein S18 acetylase RimI-like enzyme
MAGEIAGLGFRHGTTADLDLIQAAEHSYMREIEPAHEDRWLRAIERNRALWGANLERTYLAEIDGVAAGYAMWVREGDVATLITIHVVPDRRRLGLGAVLLARFMQAAQDQGCAELRLGVHRSNPARPLYESAGFVFIGEDKEYLLYALDLMA